MVPRKTDKRETVTKYPTFIISFIFLLLTIFITLMVIVYILLSHFLQNREAAIDIAGEPEMEVVEKSETETEEEIEEEIKPKIKTIDFGPVVDEWAKSVRGNKSVIIYDLDKEVTSAAYNVNEKYNTASLYKLFVVYEGYRRLEKGEWKADEIVGSTGYTISKCLDLAIRESNSLCTETLLTMIGRDNLKNIVVKDFDIKDSDVVNFVATPKDIMKMMRMFYLHPDINKKDLVSTIKDSFLNQPTTIYNWRQGLPSGFKKAKVYNKVGWEYNPDKKYWNVYHDAAIVEFPEQNRHFIVVVMTNFVAFERIRELGTKVEDYFIKNF